jgi:Family of unknown function (DUF6152)
MTRRVARLCATAVGLLLSLTPARAHHSFAAEFDANQPVTLTGVVARIDLINPHAWLYVDVRSPEGKVERWNIEMGAPNSLIRRGVTRQSVPLGAEVTIEGYRAKDGSRTVNSRTVKLADGRSLFTGSSGTGAPGESPR